MAIVFETKRLLARELTLKDAEFLYPILSDAETMRFYPSPYNMEGVQRWIYRSLESYKKNSFGLWAIILKESNQFIGQCGISLQNIDGKIVPEIGYHIHKDFWNKGYATEAALGSLNYGFKTLKLGKIYIHTSINNIPAQRIAEKLGMNKQFVYDKYLETFKVTWPIVVYSTQNI